MKEKKVAKILIIDDDKGICAWIARVISQLGLHFTFAHTLREGLEQAEAEPFDVVFLDTQLPDGCGLDFMSRFRVTGDGPEIIIITSLGDPDEAARAIANGAWDYVEKPASAEALKHPLTRALEYRADKVLISPYALLDVNKEKQLIHLDLNKKQVEDSPSLSSDQPVSRQFEETYHGYYGWPMYWEGPYIWGAYPYIARDRTLWEKASENKKTWDPNLRSTRDVTGYYIQASNDEIGHVEDFVIDDETWVIRYLIVDTKNWWPGKKVLLSPIWIERISWGQSKVFVNLLRETIQQSPEYSEALLLTREYEASLHRHYNRPVYWE